MRQLPVHRTIRMAAALCVGLSLASYTAGPRAAAAESLPEVIRQVQPKLVKIYGAGGLQGLNAYQSGFLVSPQGHVVTAWSYVLDTDYITVTLSDGRKFQGKLLGSDPRLEIAVLKIEATELSCFNLAEAATAEVGAQVLAMSNLFGVAAGNEGASVLHGVVSAKCPLAARKGAFETPYKGTAYVLDAMTNNPGAAGGVLTDRRGRLLGVLGKELINSLNNTYLNYSIPAAEVAPAVSDIIAGKIRSRAPDEKIKRAKMPVTYASLGIVLVPDVLNKTPPFVDRVLPGSAAEKGGVRSDDLVLFVGSRVVTSCKALVDELSTIEQGDEVSLTVQRKQEIVPLTLPGAP